VPGLTTAQLLLLPFGGLCLGAFARRRYAEELENRQREMLGERL
jgi:hypothetical protein